MDAVTEDTREFDEDEEEDIIVVCCVVIVLCIIGLASVSRVNNGRIGRVEERQRDTVQLLVGRGHLGGQIDGELGSGYWIGSVLFGGKRSSA